ncbi:MAG: cytochrome c oxidase subunit 2A [Chloroflexi bacterium]|nr:cytochrome c oxidase subunit 2A [Chloroflexota bacterium]
MAKKEHENNDEFRPNGTIAILVIFVITTILIWGTIYMILISRGSTI